MLEHHAAIVAATMDFAPIHGDPAGARASRPHGDAECRVVLPQPDGPISATISPSLTLKLTLVECLNVMDLAVHARSEKRLDTSRKFTSPIQFSGIVVQSVTQDLKCLFAILAAR